MKPSLPFESDQHGAVTRIVPTFPSATTNRLPPGQGPPHAPNPPMMSSQSYYGYHRGLLPPPNKRYECQRYPPYCPPYSPEQQRAGGSFGIQHFARSRSGSYEQPNGPYYAQGSFDGQNSLGNTPRVGFDRHASATISQGEVIRTTSSGSTGSAGSGTASRQGYSSGPRSFPSNPPALVNKYGHRPGTGTGIAMPPPPPPPPSLRTTGPYTTAQLESMPRGPGNVVGKQSEVEKSQAPTQQETIIKAVRLPSIRLDNVSGHIDPDERAYTTITGRSGATSPSQIDSFRREDVVTMGCTCKKSKCLKLYCMCFGASVVCGQNCRCLICHNTPSHEQIRRDAIRNILARNPTAFDTKFKKTEEETAAIAAAKSGPSRAITHKLGCKCRKSFCTKKYCECYNAGVKCSGSCRCVGCKNITTGDLGPRDQPEITNSSPKRPVLSSSFVAKRTVKQPPVVLQKSGEPWMVNAAAQNLAFLKHASPTKTNTRSVRESDGTRGNSLSSLPSLLPSETVISSSEPLADGVNSILMAAWAMTELFAQDVPLIETDDGTPEKKNIELTGFRSPKRKALGRGMHSKSMVNNVPAKENVIEDDLPIAATPNVAREMKRTRVGTMEKTHPVLAMTFESSLLCDEELNATSPAETSPINIKVCMDDESTPSVTNEEVGAGTPALPFTTPQSKKDAINMMTPVTARCIDFQHMGVTDDNESMIGEEKKESEKALVTQY